MSEYHHPSNDHNRQSSSPRRLSAEQVLLFAALFCGFIFLWLIGFLLLAIASGRSAPMALPPLVAQIAATQGFVLPPTWTPTPIQTVLPTPLPTEVWDGRMPTRIYTPRPTSLPGPFFPALTSPTAVLDLARIMQGESPGDLQAAYMVGWVAKNRLTHTSYGDTYAVVSYGFFGYRADIQPRREFLELAQRVIQSRNDPTDGCLYALSRTDITKLGIPPSRADVAYGEWFFFRTWPLNPW
ncbi:MAG: hypothetical protein JXM69_20370 [Anaerolineae bacterium]|nr:hypothetical protein [Anaerolineae bacterium]